MKTQKLILITGIICPYGIRQNRRNHRKSAIDFTSTIILLFLICSMELFAQDVTRIDTVYTPEGYKDGIQRATIFIPSPSNGVGVIVAHGLGGNRFERTWADSLAANGYVAMTIDYKDIDEGAKFPVPVTTYKLAVEFLRRNAIRFNITIDFHGKQPPVF